MRWLRGVLVAVGLALPVVVVSAIAWPSSGESRADEAETTGTGPGGALVPGDSVEGNLGPNEVDEYRLVSDEGDVDVRVGVQGGQPFDGTVTVLDADGEQVAYNDDTNGLDPEVEIELGAEELTVEVRELGGQAGTYLVYVD